MRKDWIPIGNLLRPLRCSTAVILKSYYLACCLLLYTGNLQNLGQLPKTDTLWLHSPRVGMRFRCPRRISCFTAVWLRCNSWNLFADLRNSEFLPQLKVELVMALASSRGLRVPAHMPPSVMKLKVPDILRSEYFSGWERIRRTRSISSFPGKVFLSRLKIVGLTDLPPRQFP